MICITLDNDSGVTRQLFALEISPVVKAFLSVCPFLVQIAHFCFVFVVELYIDKLVWFNKQIANNSIHYPDDSALCYELNDET